MEEGVVVVRTGAWCWRWYGGKTLASVMYLKKTKSGNKKRKAI